MEKGGSITNLLVNLAFLVMPVWRLALAKNRPHRIPLIATGHNATIHIPDGSGNPSGRI
jgi:hypothetical protein